MWRSLVCAVVLCAHAQCSEPESRVVQTAQGAVRGYREPDYDLYAFYGIPYATAPTGTKRFREPQPPPVWLHTLEAVEKRIVCPQARLPIDMNMGHFLEQENCLIANVYVPDTEKTNLPVVVIVHGGAFQIGFGDLMKFKNVVKTKKAIVVTFNYRLGIHGFLCLGTKNVPGNAGMKDQVALLRWVKENIASFGGNPDDVTIDGYSAGSASVDLLMLSKSTGGLFNKVIAESGANLAVWSVQIDPIENAKKFALSENFNEVDNINALENFFTSVPYDVLTKDAFWNRTDSTFMFSPCVERDTGKDAFLKDSPLNILKNGGYKKTPLLYGFANMEGLLRMDFFDSWKTRMDEKFSDFLPADLKFENNAEREKVAHDIKSFYFGTKSVADSVLKYIDYFSDIFFNYSTLRAIKLHLEAGHSNIFLYEYSYIEKALTAFPDIEGAGHCAQTGAVVDGGNFGNSDESNISNDYRKVKDYMRKLWINFIETGSPVPADSSLTPWLPATSSTGPYMSLGQTMVLKDNLIEDRFLFWDAIYDKYYNNPSPPPKPAFTHTDL